MIVSAQIGSRKAYSEPDAAQIYEELVPTQHQKVVPVLTTTAVPETCTAKEKDILNPAFREAMEAFNEVNKQKWDLSEELKHQKTISEYELDSTFKPGVVEGWKGGNGFDRDIRGSRVTSSCQPSVSTKHTQLPLSTRQDDAVPIAAPADSSTSVALRKGGRKSR
jgi:hypothetical protein